MSLLTEMIMDAMKEREAEEAEEREWERLIKETEEREQARFEKEAQAREFEEARMAREAQAREFEEARIAREALAKEIEELRMARETEVREARKREELRMARETEAREAREREEMRMAWEAEALIPAPVNEVRPQAVSPVPSPVYSAEPMATASPSEQQRPDVKIIPALPDPNNGKVYNLQLGAFSRQGTALEIASRVRNAGFDAVQEFSGSAYRVIAKDVPASMVPFAVQRLGAMGISEIWIKEK
jgi:cell division septation protein DedD